MADPTNLLNLYLPNPSQTPSRDHHVALRNARAAYRVHIATVSAGVLGGLAFIIIVIALVLRYRKHRIRTELPTVLVTSPRSPHVWVVPPGAEVDRTHLAPPKCPNAGEK
ncbi:hypothetical protein CspHIS471_0502070 [Cutaneotrichosporon sp. HIS471]|nr:hypothetical protein CspHIS471_0502070 [Cutaneotrichosporon sp. HIS471]